MAEDVVRGRKKIVSWNIEHITFNWYDPDHSFIYPILLYDSQQQLFRLFFCVDQNHWYRPFPSLRSLRLQNKYKQPIFDRNCTNTQTNIALNSDFAYVYSIFLRLYLFSLLLLFFNFLNVNLFLPFYGIKCFCSVFHLAISQFLQYIQMDELGHIGFRFDFEQ